MPAPARCTTESFRSIRSTIDLALDVSTHREHPRRPARRARTTPWSDGPGPTRSGGPRWSLPAARKQYRIDAHDGRSARRPRGSDVCPESRRPIETFWVPLDRARVRRRREVDAARSRPAAAPGVHRRPRRTDELGALDAHAVARRRGDERDTRGRAPSRAPPRSPGSESSAAAAGTSSTPKQMWWSPSPCSSSQLPSGESPSSGSTSCRYALPASR